MRITSSSTSDQLLFSLNRLGSRQAALQAEASTGQRVRSASDDPTAMRDILDLENQSKTQGQYRANLGVHQQNAAATFDVIRSLQTVSNRAQEIALLADGLKSPEEMQSYAAEVGQLLDRAVQLANTRQGDQYLLAGTVAAQQPFVAVKNDQGQTTEVQYKGNENANSSEIGEGVLVQSQVPGENNSGSGPRGLLADSRGGADLFKHLVALQQNLLAGNTTAIASQSRPDLKHDEDNLLYHTTQNASLQSRLEATDGLLKSKQTALSSQVSKEADADLAQTMINLSQTQTAYQVALQSTAKIMDVSLLDFIR